MDNKEYINLEQWMQRHPRLTAIAKISPDNPSMGKIIAESNHPGTIRIQFEDIDDKKNYRLIP